MKTTIGSFWTSRQRQANSLHELSYRACFKPQLPEFFIKRYSQVGDTIYDPFGGRGTTAIEAALCARSPIQNDINPLSTILCGGRLAAPTLEEIEQRLNSINLSAPVGSLELFDLDLGMFFENQTLTEIYNLRSYFLTQEKNQTMNSIDAWIRAVAVNRLTGHSKGFFSVYTLPPNQAASRKRQMKINSDMGNTPEYRDVKACILKKSKQLLKDVDEQARLNLHNAYKTALLLTGDASHTPEIADNSVQLTITSPPFLDVVQYASDNWMRCWFCGIDETALDITMAKNLDDWSKKMTAVLTEVFRMTKPGGYVAFEVGEVRNGTINLEEAAQQCGSAAGLTPHEVLINQQSFTKTSNIWGISNNTGGTNSNRIVLFRKEI